MILARTLRLASAKATEREMERTCLLDLVRLRADKSYVPFYGADPINYKITTKEKKVGL